MGAGTAAEIGLTIGVGIIGGIAAAIAGWNLGQILYENLTGEEIDMSWSEQIMYVLKAPFEDLNSYVDGLVTTLTDFENNPVLTVLADILAGPFVTGAAIILDNKEEISKSIDDIKGKFEELKNKLGEKWNGLEKWYNEDVRPWFTKSKWSELGENTSQSLKEKWNGFKTWWGQSGVSKWYNDSVKPWFDSKNWSFDGIKIGLKTSFNNAISAVKQVWNEFANWLNGKLTWKIDPVVVMGKKIFDGTTINLGKIPTFQSGGFPEDGLFMANHDELVGQFSNGKTAVANNMQITDGIRQAAYEGMRMALSEYQSGNTNVNVTLQGDADGLFRVVQDKANNYTMQNGRPAFMV